MSKHQQFIPLKNHKGLVRLSDMVLVMTVMSQDESIDLENITKVKTSCTLCLDDKPIVKNVIQFDKEKSNDH
jgi:hypothetical protein